MTFGTASRSKKFSRVVATKKKRVFQKSTLFAFIVICPLAGRAWLLPPSLDEMIDQALKDKAVDKKVRQKINYTKKNWPDNLKLHSWNKHGCRISDLSWRDPRPARGGAGRPTKSGSARFSRDAATRPGRPEAKEKKRAFYFETPS